MHLAAAGGRLEGGDLLGRVGPQESAGHGMPGGAELVHVHHVRSGPAELAYDLGFLALGAVLAVVGALLSRSARSQADV